MSKKAKSKTSRGPTARQVGASIAQHSPAIAMEAARLGQSLVNSAMQLGQHKARAELLAPTLAALHHAANARATGSDKHFGVSVNATSCQLLLLCLAEAGYKPPTPQDGEKANAMVWAPVGARQPCENTATWPERSSGSGQTEAPPAAKAA